MAEVEVSRKESLKDEGEPFDESGNYQKALRFGDEKLKAELTGYIEYINTRNENARLEGAYQAAKVSMASADKTTNARDIPARYTAAAQAFKKLGNYQDSVALAQECRKLAENAEKDLVLTQVKLFMQYDTAYWYGRAIELLNTIPGW